MSSYRKSLSGTISHKKKEEIFNSIDFINPNNQINFYLKKELRTSNPSLTTKETCASDDERISLTFEWKEPCENVKITGDFSNWEAINMQKNINTGFFEYNTILPKKIIYFKFIVGSKWKCSENYQIEKDNYNNINNFIDLTTTNGSKKNSYKKSNNIIINDKKQNSEYSCDFPKIGDFGKVPKIPNLFKNVLNLDKDLNQNDLFFKGKKRVDKNNCFKKIISIPHDKLNHLFFPREYCKIKQYSKIMMTQRVRRNLTTIIYYTPK